MITEEQFLAKLLRALEQPEVAEKVRALVEPDSDDAPWMIGESVGVVEGAAELGEHADESMQGEYAARWLELLRSAGTRFRFFDNRIEPSAGSGGPKPADE